MHKYILKYACYTLFCYSLFAVSLGFAQDGSGIVFSNPITPVAKIETAQSAVNNDSPQNEAKKAAVSTASSAKELKTQKSQEPATTNATLSSNAQKEAGNKEATKEKNSEPESKFSLPSLNEAVETITGQDPLALALQNIELAMGENGLEIWRLKAKWAAMKESDGNIEVTSPYITYFMGSQNKATQKTDAAQKESAPNETTQEQQKASAEHQADKNEEDNPKNLVFVNADKGIVRQKDKFIRLEGNVVAINGESIITGPVMQYNGSDKNIDFVDGMEFKAKNLTGKAARGFWNTETNVLTATGGVFMTSLVPAPHKKEASENLEQSEISPVTTTETPPTPPPAKKLSKTKKTNSKIKS